MLEARALRPDVLEMWLDRIDGDIDQLFGANGYSIAADIFAERLKELSKGTMLIDQYPGAQLGQEPQVLQLVKSGDVEFCISSSANAATLSRYAARGVRMQRTDRDGAVTVTVDAQGRLWVACVRGCQ